VTFAESHAAAADRWPAGTTSTEVPTSWGTTHLLMAGPTDAPVVLLLHGGGATATVWADLAVELVPQHRLLAPDQPGDAGLSSRAGAPRSTADLVAWLTELSGAFGRGPWHVVGHSAGAHLGLSAALDHPAGIQTLTLLDPTAVVTGFSPRYLAHGLPGLLRPSEARIRRFLTWETGGRELPEPWVDAYLRGATEPGRGPLVRTRRPDRRRLSTLCVPTLVIVAGSSRAHDPDRLVRRASALPGTEVVRLPGATHHTLPLLDAPAVAVALRAHLAVGAS
jgi:pimeloyl-ACP methyl ester carboxylesterase